MVPWQIWLIIAGVCLIIEIVTVGFFRILVCNSSSDNSSVKSIYPQHNCSSYYIYYNFCYTNLFNQTIN